MKKSLGEMGKIILIVLLLLSISKIACSQPAISDKATFSQNQDGTYTFSHYDYYDGMSISPKASFTPTGNVKDFLWEKTIKEIQSGEITTIQDIELSNSQFNQGDYIIAGYTLRYDRLIQYFDNHPSGKDYWLIRLRRLEPESTTLYFCSIFPNPFITETSLFVSKEYTTGKYWVTLYDFLGKTIKLIPIKDKQTKIYKENLSSGVYYYSINSSTQSGPKSKLVVL